MTSKQSIGPRNWDGGAVWRRTLIVSNLFVRNICYLSVSCSQIHMDHMDVWMYVCMVCEQSVGWKRMHTYGCPTDDVVS